MGFALTTVANPGQSQGPDPLLPGTTTSVQTKLASPHTTLTDQKEMVPRPQGIRASSGEVKLSLGSCSSPAWLRLAGLFPKQGWSLGSCLLL